MSGLTLEDLPSALASPAGRRGDDRARRARRKRRRARALVVLLVCLVALGGATWVAGGQLRGVVDQMTTPKDWTGPGRGSVQVDIAAGSSARTIGQELAARGVVKTAGAFSDAAAQDTRASSLQPGTYVLREHMSSAAALALLLDPSSHRSSKVTIPEGFSAAKTLGRLAQVTGKPLAAFQAATRDPALGLPPVAHGSVEGYLYPATYTFDLSATPTAMLAAMVARGQQELTSLGVPADPVRRHQLLTEASLVQAEAGDDADMGKIARVLDNRLAVGMPLQLDTTVDYATGKAALTTTAADRANPSPYNTYLHPGLPPGPISAPGAAALKAVLSPTPGPWRFFVVVNPATGQTLFATTAAEHQVNVAKFQAWLRAHPQG